MEEFDIKVTEVKLDTKGELSTLDKSSLNGYNNKLEAQFGPKNTASGQVLNEIRESVKEVLRDGLEKEGTKTLVSVTKH